MVFGSVLHSTLAEYHLSIANGKASERAYLLDFQAKQWRERLKREPISFKNGENETDLLDLSIRLLELYLNDSSPENIVGVERAFWVPMMTSNGVILEKPLLAIVDLITKSNERMVITEFKTSSRNYSESDVQHSLQASCYAHALQSRFGNLPEIGYTVFVKTKTPKLQRLSTTRTIEQNCRLGDIAHQIECAVASKIFYPIESAMNCSGCSFRTECKAWSSWSKNKVVPTVGRRPEGVLSAC
jgi:CRISPR/Cas system-associated exonuclease Cas4 (RecB family)